MSAFVVDTNVPVVANGKADHAVPDCVLACLAALEEVQAGGIIVLDSEMRILTEYMHNLSLSGQPGAGDLFMKWVWTIQAVVTRCEQVQLRQQGTDPDEFAEFPDDFDLEGFDRSDRKFAAVALTSVHNPHVLNAVDADWWHYRQPLEKHGVRIKFLCPNQFDDE